MQIHRLHMYILLAERRMRHKTTGMYEGMEIDTKHTFSIWLTWFVHGLTGRSM